MQTELFENKNIPAPGQAYTIQPNGTRSFDESMLAPGDYKVSVVSPQFGLFMVDGDPWQSYKITDYAFSVFSQQT